MRPHISSLSLSLSLCARAFVSIVAHGCVFVLLTVSMNAGTTVELIFETNRNRLTHIHNPARPGGNSVICVIPSFHEAKVMPIRTSAHT
jgi:hypothetical protein